MSQWVRRWSEAGLLALLAVTMLWKGGKSLESTWLFAAAAAFLVLLQSMFLRPDVAVPRRLWWPVMGLLAWTLLSFVASSTRNYGFDELLQSAAFSLLFCWAIREYAVAGNNIFAQRVARTIAFVAYFACAIGVVVYVLQPVNRFVGSFFDHRFTTDYWPNAWAQLCLLSWPLVVWTLFSPEAGWKREKFTEPKIMLHWVVAGFFIGCFFLSYSRAGFLAFVGQLGLAALLLFIAFRSRIEWKKLLVAVLTVAFTAMLWFSAVNVLRSHFHPVESVIKKATFSSAEGGSSFSERAQFWQQAAALSVQRPLLGWGPYSFRFVQPRLQQSVLATSDHAHNVLLKFAMERGWLAALLLACIGFTVAVQGFFSWKQWSRQHANGAHLKFAMFIGFIGVAAHNMVDFNLQFIGILLPLCIVSAVLAVPPVLRHSARRAKSQQIIEGLLAILVLLFAMREGVFLFLSSRGRHAEANGNVIQALQYYHASEGALFTRDLFLSKAGLLLGETAKLSDDKLAEAEAALHAYATGNSEDQRLWKLRGDLADTRGEPTEAISQYKQAEALGKYNDIGIAFLLLRAMAGPQEKATPDIDAWRPELERLMNDFSFAIEQNAHFISLSRNVEGLVETAKLMAKLYPEDADAYDQLIDHVQAKSAVDRAKFSGRPDGLLWGARR